MFGTGRSESDPYHTSLRWWQRFASFRDPQGTQFHRASPAAFATEVVRFAVYLGQQDGLSGATIGNYVYNVRRYASLVHGLAYTRETLPAQEQQLDTLLRRLRAWKISSHRPKPRVVLPLPYLAALLRDPGTPVGYKALITLMLATLARPGDLLPTSTHDPNRHFHLGMIEFSKGSFLFTIWRKADNLKPFRYIVTPIMDHPLFCPVTWMKSHLRQRIRARKGRKLRATEPVFVDNDGIAITSNLLTQFLQSRPDSKKGYVASSIRPTGATLLAASGQHDDTIRRIGGWSSAAYERYIRPVLRPHLATMSAMLKSENWDLHVFPPSRAATLPGPSHTVRFQ